MNTRKLNMTLIAAALIAATGAVQAGNRQDSDRAARARVISSTPVYETVNEPRRECWTETVGYETYSNSGHNTAGAVIGGVAGGLIGSTVGKGSGKVAAAAVGAATGAVIGDRWNSTGSYTSRPQQVERCATRDNYRQVLAGYDVRYRFEGREFTTRLPYDPGDWLTLNVRFTVADNQYGGYGRPGHKHWEDD